MSRLSSNTTNHISSELKKRHLHVCKLATTDVAGSVGLW